VRVAPSVISADREAVRRGGLPAFVELALRYKHGPKYKPARHLTVLAEHVEMLYRGDITMLATSLPPQVGKSEVSSVCAPAWIWTLDPTYKFMMASYDEGLAKRLAKWHLDMCKGDWYRDRWGDMIVHGPDAWSNFYTTSNGYRASYSVQAGGGIGNTANWYGIDDPLKSEALDKTPALLETVWQWFDSRVLTRGGPGTVLRVNVTMQRLHEEDLIGRMVHEFEGTEGFRYLMLPLLYEPERADPADWRMKPGDLLWPEDAQRLHATAARYSASRGGKRGRNFRAYYQQDPKGGDDRIFKAEHFQGFEDAPPFAQTLSCIVIDPTFTGKPRSDDMAIEVWGFHGGHYYCYHSEQSKRGFVEAHEAIVNLRKVWPALTVLVEESANGYALIETLKRALPGCVIVGVKPHGQSKEGRARAASHYFAAGKVHFDKSAPWYEDKARYLVRFPSPGVVDDSVDTTSHAILWLAEQYGTAGAMVEAMQILEGERHEALEKEGKDYFVGNFPLPKMTPYGLKGFHAR
jgi:predicted phage terminase large subunit-like protein